jgi:hypothetical protein
LGTLKRAFIPSSRFSVAFGPSLYFRFFHIWTRLLVSINLTKKLRKDVRVGLISLQQGLNRIRAQIEANTTQNKQQPPPEIAVVVRRTQSEIDEETTRNAHHEGRDSKRLLIETVGVVLGTILACATILQWIQTREATRIASISARASMESAEASKAGVLATQKSIETSID